MSYGLLKTSSTKQGWYVRSVIIHALWHHLVQCWMKWLRTPFGRVRSAVHLNRVIDSSDFRSGNDVLPRGRHRRRHRRFQTSYWALPVWTGLCDWQINCRKWVEHEVDTGLCFHCVIGPVLPLHSPDLLPTWHSFEKLPISNWSTDGRKKPLVTWSSCGSEFQPCKTLQFNMWDIFRSKYT